MKNKVLVILVLLLVTAGLLFAGGKQEKSTQEKELVVYSTIFAKYAETMKTLFEKENPGVTVNVINPGGTEAMIKKIEAESANPQADIMHSGSSLNYAYAKSKGLLQPYFPKVEGFKPSIEIGGKTLNLSDPEGYYHVFNMMFSGLMINTDILKEKGLPVPRSYKDLTNPVYKGQIISANPLKSSTAFTNVMAIYESYGDASWDIWDGINKNIPYYSNSSSKIYTLTKKGEFAIAICLSRPVFVAKNDGYPVDFVFPEDGSMVADNSMGIVKGAKHPELAKKFIDFILSDAMQKYGAQFLYIPVKSGALDPSSPYSLESISKKIKKILIPDAKVADKVRPIVQEQFAKYIRAK